VPLYAAAALMYFVVNFIVSSSGRRLERRFAF
jgi:ABC-type amino acid transport system permease subunit